MKNRPVRFGVGTIFILLPLLSCTPTEFQAGREIMSGRNALLLGHPQSALPNFQAIAQTDPNYINCESGFCVGLWTYLGRTYHELGKNQEALESLKKGEGLHPRDRMNKIYLGLLMALTGNVNQGTRMLDSGLKDLGSWLAGFAGRGYEGSFWDPGNNLQREITGLQQLVQQDNIDWRRVDRGVHRLSLNLEQEVRDVRNQMELESTRGGPR